MKLVHISDLHLIAADTPLFGRRPVQHLDMCFDHLIGEHGDADCLVISGDLAQNGRADAYAVLKQRLERLPMPYHLMLGNHDKRDRFYAAFPDHPSDHNGFVQYTVDYGDLRLIMLDTHEPSEHAGSYGERRLRWLSGELDRAREDDRQVLLFLHHHPIKIGVIGIDQIRLREADGLIELLAAHRQTIRHIAFGHCHIAMSGSIADIPFSAPRSINHVCWPDLSGINRLAFADIEPNYNVFLVSPGSIVVHTIEFRVAPDLSGAKIPDDLFDD